MTSQGYPNQLGRHHHGGSAGTGRRNLAALAAVTLTAAALGGTAAQADNFATTEIQLLYGDGFKLGRNGFGGTERLTATIEHFSTWNYGDNFFFVDINRDFTGSGGGAGSKSDEYGEYWTHLSGSKIFGFDFGNSLIRDINLGAGINAGTDFTVLAYGPRVDFNMPGFDVLTFGFYGYNNVDDPFGRSLDTTYQATVVWSAPLIRQGRINLWTQGFVDFIGDQGSGVDNQIVFQPQLRLDLGQAMGGTAGKVEVGVEYAYFDNKFGVTDVEDNVLQALLVYNFH